MQPAYLLLEKLAAALNRIPRWLLAFGVCIAPGTAVCIILIALRVNPLNFVPNTLNDQISNWHTILTFSHVGFGGGYYSPHELEAPVESIRFGVIGPAFPILYGSIAHFVGWEPYSGIIFNMAAVGLSLAFFIYITRLNRLQLAVTGLVILTFWTIIIFMPTVMQESLNHAIAITLAGLFYSLLPRDAAATRSVKIGTGIVLVAASLLRSSWAILFIPYWLLVFSQWRLAVRLLAAVSLTAALTTAILLVLQNISPPTNNSVLTAVKSFQFSLGEGFQNVRVAVEQNFITLDSTLRATPTFPLQLIHHLGLILVNIGLLVVILRRRGNDVESTAGVSVREAAFQVYNLSVIILAGFVLYLAGGFPRVFAAHLLLSLMIAVSFKRYAIVVIVVVTNLLLAGAVGYDMATYRNENFKSDPAERAILLDEVNRQIVYDSDATNAWCNTVFIPVALYDGRMTLVPPGIGIAYYWNPQLLNFPLKSRYVLLTPETAEPIVTKSDLQLLTSLSIGDIYLNRDAACE
jgi:hypothetical protein